MTVELFGGNKKHKFSITQFYDGKGISYQITQRYDNIGYPDDDYSDELRHVFGFVQLTEDDLIFIIRKIRSRKHE